MFCFRLLFVSSLPRPVMCCVLASSLDLLHSTCFLFGFSFFAGLVAALPYVFIYAGLVAALPYVFIHAFAPIPPLFSFLLFIVLVCLVFVLCAFRVCFAPPVFFCYLFNFLFAFC